MKTKRVKFQQGDVLFKKIDRLPNGVKKTEENVLAEGEATGHFHALQSLGLDSPTRKEQVDGLAFYRDSFGNTYVDIKKPLEVTHQEHDRFVVTPGTYHIDIVREYSYDTMETKRVID